MVAEERDAVRVLPLNVAHKMFEQIVEQVERGETVLITRGGRVIAGFSPPSEEQCALIEGTEEAQRFLEEIAALREGRPTGVTREEILAWRHEGHRR
ncbi:MAG: hypothetical protein OXD50_08780 [Chloroflexi bacterium]|nr:hypothetical protein [Chloroflexota bacterium]